MKKDMKKIISLLLTILLVLGMATNVSAAFCNQGSPQTLSDENLLVSAKKTENKSGTYEKKTFYNIQAAYYLESVDNKMIAQSEIVTLEEQTPWVIHVGSSSGTGTINVPQNIIVGEVDNYIFDPVATTDSLQGVITDNTTVNLIYSLDVIGEDALFEPDGIPDRYQATVIYEASGNGNIAKGARHKEVITLMDGEKWSESAAITVSGSEAVPYTDHVFSKWTLRKNLGEIEDLTVNSKFSEYTLENVKGGDVFKFTAHFAKGHQTYSIEHYKWNKETGKYEIVAEDTEELIGAIGSRVEATPNTYEGYVFNPQAEGTLLKGNVPESNYSKLTLKLYYDIIEPSIDIYKKADLEKAKAGDEITYTITIENTGNCMLNSIEVLDSMVYLDGTPAAGTFKNTAGSNDGNVNVFHVEKLDVGDEVSFSYTYTVDLLDEEKTLVNTASATMDGEEVPMDTAEAKITVDPYIPSLEYDDHFAYIIGYTDGTVRPKGYITRAEVATIFFRLLDEESRNLCLTDQNNFTDVNESAWYNNAISTLVKAGVLTGYRMPDGTYEFRPDAPIKRSELAAIATRFNTVMKNEADEATIRFADLAAEHWAYDEIMTAAARGWVTGEKQSDGVYIFRADDNIIRCEAMQMINNVLMRSVDEAGVAAGNAVNSQYYNTWSDNNDPTAWYYNVIQEATNSHDWETGTRINSKLSVGDCEVYFEDWVEVLQVPDWAAWQKTLEK